MMQEDKKITMKEALERYGFEVDEQPGRLIGRKYGSAFLIPLMDDEREPALILLSFAYMVNSGEVKANICFENDDHKSNDECEREAEDYVKSLQKAAAEYARAVLSEEEFKMEMTDLGVNA